MCVCGLSEFSRGVWVVCANFLGLRWCLCKFSGVGCVCELCKFSRGVVVVCPNFQGWVVCVNFLVWTGCLCKFSSVWGLYCANFLVCGWFGQIF